MKIGAALRKKQLSFVEQNLDKARENPQQCGIAMKKRGYYSPSTNDKDLGLFVLGLIRTIDKKRLLARQPMLKGLFDDTAFKNQNAGAKWTSEEDNKLLNDYFNGMDLERIAVKYKRNPKAVARHIEEFKYNERETASSYCPSRRYTREGARLTALDKEFIEAHKERNVSPEVTAAILQRKVSEFYKDTTGFNYNQRLKQVAPTADIVLAHRYLYWCVKKSIVSNEAYDDFKKEEIEFGGAGSILLQPASDIATDYPPHIRSLATYMLFKCWETEGYPDKMKAKLNYGALMEYQKNWLKKTGVEEKK